VAADELVVTLQEVAPGAVADGGRAFGRPDNVRKEHRGERPVGLGFLPAAGIPDLRQEELHFRRDRGRGPSPCHNVRGAGQLHKTGSRNRFGDISRHADRDDRVVCCVQDERRHANCREHVADIDVSVHESEGLYRAWAPAPPVVLDPLLRLSVLELHARAQSFLGLVTPTEQE
jgi:hypothetical protein